MFEHLLHVDSVLDASLDEHLSGIQWEIRGSSSEHNDVVILLVCLFEHLLHIKAVFSAGIDQEPQCVTGDLTL